MVTSPPRVASGAHLLRVERPGPAPTPEPPGGRGEGAADAQRRVGEPLPGHRMHLRPLAKMENGWGIWQL